MGVNFLEPDYETSPTHPLALKRTFGSTEPIRVKLYRCGNGVSAAGLRGVCLLSQQQTSFYTCTPCGGPRARTAHCQRWHACFQGPLQRSPPPLQTSNASVGCIAWLHLLMVAMQLPSSNPTS